MRNGLIVSVGIFLVIAFMFSCQPSVVFGEPQPVAVKPLSTIPNIYRGIYWCNVDSASLYVDDRAFVRRKEFLIKTTREEIGVDPDLELVNGQLYVKDWEGYFSITEKGDTLILGFGGGIVPKELSKRNFNIDVVEINPATLNIAERFFKYKKNNTNFFLKMLEYL